MGEKVVEIGTKDKLLGDFWEMLSALSGNEKASKECLEESIHYQHTANQDPKLYRGTFEKVTKD